MKKEHNWIVGTKTEAVKFAKQGLRLNDKTLRLKNVRVIDAAFTLCKHKGRVKENIPAVKVVADTDMQNNAIMVVGYSRKHQNVFPPNFSDKKK